MRTKILLTSQLSFCPFAYPAHKNDGKIFFLWPACSNISWHTVFSIMGTFFKGEETTEEEEMNEKILYIK